MAFITKNEALDKGAYTDLETTDEFPTKDELRKNWCYNPLKSGFQDYNSNDFVDNGDYVDNSYFGNGIQVDSQGFHRVNGTDLNICGFTETSVTDNCTDEGYSGSAIIGSINSTINAYNTTGMVTPDTWYYVSALVKIADISLLSTTSTTNLIYMTPASIFGQNSIGLGINTSGRLVLSYNPTSNPNSQPAVSTISEDTFTLGSNVWYLVSLCWNPTSLVGMGVIESDMGRVIVKGARCLSNVLTYALSDQVRVTLASDGNITCKWVKQCIGAASNETFTRGLTKLASMRFTPMNYNHTGNMIGYATLTSMEVVEDESPKGILNFANNYSYTNPASATGVAVSSLPYRGMKFTSMPSLAELGVEDPGSVAGDKFVVDFIVYFDGHKPTTNDANEDGHQYYCIGGVNYSYPYQDVTGGFGGANTILYGDLNSNTFHIGTMNYSTISQGLSRISVTSSGSINLDLDYTKPYIFRLYYPSYGAAGQFDILDYNTREVLGTWSGTIAGGAGRKPALSILIGSCGVSVSSTRETYYENIGTVSNLIYLGVDTYTTVGEGESGNIFKYNTDFSSQYDTSVTTKTGAGTTGNIVTTTINGGQYYGANQAMKVPGYKLSASDTNDFPLVVSNTTHLYNYPFSFGNDEWIHYRYAITLDTSISISNGKNRALATIVGSKIDSNSTDLFELALVHVQNSSSTFSLISWLNINGADSTDGASIQYTHQSNISYDTLKGDSSDITIVWDVIFNKDGDFCKTLCYDMEGNPLGTTVTYNESDFNNPFTNPNNSTKNAIYILNPYVPVNKQAESLPVNPSYVYSNVGIIRQLFITHNHYYASL